MIKYYAGIGSRSAPFDVCTKFRDVARKLEEKGFTLRSGGAIGADQAFEQGVTQPKMKEIFRWKQCTENAEKLASTIHPAWDRCNDVARKLHGRNLQIILGAELSMPVSFVVAWTLDPNKGGTRTGLEAARLNNIPVYNFAVSQDEGKFWNDFKAW